MKARLETVISTILFMVLVACSPDGSRTICVGDSEIPELLLKFQSPVEFTFTLRKETEYELGLSLTYFEDGIGERTSFPLYIQTIGPSIPPDSEDREKLLDVSLFDNGQSLGTESGNGKDKIIRQVYLTKTLAPGTYTIRIHANEKNGKDIYGISKIAFDVKKKATNT